MAHTLICIEGTDGSGKKTQSEMLVNYFKDKGQNVRIVAFPNYESISSGPVKMYLGGEFGERASCLDSYQASSLYAVDRLCTMKTIMNELSEDTVIIFDRYVSSNMLHQAGKIEDDNERDIFLDWIDNFEFNVLKLPRPDKVFFLDLPPKIAFDVANTRESQKTGNKIDIHERDLNHIKDAYNSAKFSAKKFGWVTIPCVDKGERLTVEQVHALIVEAL